MSEQIHDQVSAFIDDELSAEECAFLVRRFDRDPESRNKLIRYSLIGAALRAELLQPNPDMLRHRVRDALSGSAPAVKTAAPASAAPRVAAHARWATPTVGLGIAASVAVAALFTVRLLNQTDGITDAPIATAGTGAGMYVVPSDAQESRVVSPPPIRMTNYLLHHGEYARLSRTLVYSNVVGTMDLPVITDAAAAEEPPALQSERDAR